MARRLSSSTAALLLLLLSLLTVAHCRALGTVPTTEAAGSATAAAGDDENGPPNPTLPAEAVLPAEQQQQHGFLRLPSHRLRRHHPCSRGLFHRHLWRARHHGAFAAEDAPRRFHYRHGEALGHLVASPAGETREVKAVAEPNPDRSLPDGDGEGEVAASSREPYSFADADGSAHEEAAAHEDEGAAVRAWTKEMQRRWWQLHPHGMRLHRHHRDEEEQEAAEGLKRFHFHHHHDHDEEEENHAMRKRFRHDDESDSDDEDEEVEELVRRFRKAIMRRRSSGHGRRFRHHHRHAGEAEKADAQEEGGVVSWIKDLIMNRF